MRWDYEVDVVVAGAGACGLIAGAKIAETRQIAVIFDRRSSAQSNAAISGGAIAAGGTPMQRDAGIVDSPESHARDILAKNRHGADAAVVRALCHVAPKYVEWIDRVVGYPLDVAQEMRRAGHSAPRLHVDRDRSGGRPLIQALRQYAATLPDLTIVDGTPVTGLIVVGGRVEGITVDEAGERRTVRASSTVLATDGFGANDAMVSQHLGSIGRSEYIGADGSLGDGIAWARDAGAALEDMSAYQAHGMVVPKFRTRLNPAVFIEGGIAVDEKGSRFVAEDIGYSELASHVLDRAAKRAIAIWDKAVHERIRDSEMMRQSADAGAFRSFPDLDSLAAHFGLADERLAKTMADYRTFAGIGQDPFGRQTFPTSMDPPYFACWITGALVHTQGGVRVDPGGRVLRQNGTAIKNLYAGGGVARGVSGSGADGYLSGNGLLGAFGLGWLIAERIATSAASGQGIT